MATTTPLEPPSASGTKPDPIARIINRTPEEVLAAREAIFAKSPPPRPLPQGKTWIDLVVGQ